jgi:NAD-dependent deacetylase
VLFGEAMPIAAVEEAFSLARAADLMVVVGSSLVVHPAAQIPLAAVESGADLVIINAEPTPLDRFAKLVIRGRSGEVLPEVAALMSAVED